MGKLNEIQEQMTQSYGDNAFTTIIKDDTVEFDSLKDKFTFADEVEVPSLKVNGESVSSQVQSDWNQNDSEAVDFIKNKPTIPSAQVQSDWNQNDSESVDYIKNRICYESTTYTQCVSFTGANGSDFVYSNWDINPEAGKTYTVIANGIEYEGPSYSTPSSGCIIIINKQEGGQVSIEYGNFGSYNGRCMCGGPTAPYDVVVKEATTTVTTIPEKFIPDNISRKNMALYSSPSSIKPNAYSDSYEQDSNGNIIIDVTGIEEGTCANYYGSIDVEESTSIIAKTTDGESIAVKRNIANFVEWGNYMFRGTLVYRPGRPTGNRYFFDVFFFEKQQ